jgi:hypothetical protein
MRGSLSCGLVEAPGLGINSLRSQRLLEGGLQHVSLKMSGGCEVCGGVVYLRLLESRERWDGRRLSAPRSPNWFGCEIDNSSGSAREKSSNVPLSISAQGDNRLPFRVLQLHSHSSRAL